MRGRQLNPMTVCGLITGFHPIGKLGNIQVVAKKLPCQSGQPLESQQLASGFRNRKSVGRRLRDHANESQFCDGARRHDHRRASQNRVGCADMKRMVD